MNHSPALAACLTASAMLLASGRAAAQQTTTTATPLAPVETERTVTEASGPSMGLVVSGIVVFGAAYVPAVVVAAGSSLDADHTLYVPLAGPWMNLAQRPGCGEGSNCNQENTYKVLVATDGVFQAIGAVTTVLGFLIPAHRTTTVRSATPAPDWHVSPVAFGKGAYGMQVVGTF